TASLLAIGCVMARQCHLNTCPAGIATQDETMRARFTGSPEMVMAYFRGVAGKVRERLAALGMRRLDEIVGSVGKLRPRSEMAEGSLGQLLKEVPVRTTESAEASKDAVGVHGELVRVVGKLKARPPRALKFSITNADRTVGAHLSGQFLRRSEFAGLDGDMIDCEFRGTAGQSFGAFLFSGSRVRLVGEANDFVGKGLSGGTVAISAGAEAARGGDVLAGNTVLYGATSGGLFVAGRAGAGFAVRNSGALAVGGCVGQHGCEYMTAGVVVLLGSAGVNLGSGMTGGLLYALKSSLEYESVNHEFIHCADASGRLAVNLDEQEEAWLRRVLRAHAQFTGSPKARRLLKSEARLPIVR